MKWDTAYWVSLDGPPYHLEFVFPVGTKNTFLPTGGCEKALIRSRSEAGALSNCIHWQGKWTSCVQVQGLRDPIWWFFFWINGWDWWRAMSERMRWDTAQLCSMESHMIRAGISRGIYYTEKIFSWNPGPDLIIL